MRRGRIVKEIELPDADPEVEVYVITTVNPEAIPVELPQPYEPAVPVLPQDPEKKEEA